MIPFGRNHRGFANSLSLDDFPASICPKRVRRLQPTWLALPDVKRQDSKRDSYGCYGHPGRPEYLAVSLARRVAFTPFFLSR
jgi:hypothetical protein